jgi:hypothetical protein
VEQDTLQSMLKSRVNQVCEAETVTRCKLSTLAHLRMFVPCMFMSFLAWSCCFLGWIDAPSLYRHALRYGTLDQSARKNEILNHLASNYREDTQNFGPLLVNNWSVCEDCFKGLYCISDTEWKRLKACVLKGQHTFVHGNTGQAHGPTDTGLQTRAWMHSHFHTVGDFQPDTGFIHLSPVAKVDVYEEAQKDLAVGGQAILDYTTFCNVWRSEFPDVKIPSEKRLGKCDECVDIHEHIQAERDPAERRVWKAKQIQHSKFVKSERLVYHTWRRKCRDDPSKQLCINIDGMDQVELFYFACRRLRVMIFYIAICRPRQMWES